MIDHTGIGAADVVRSGVFYDSVLGALGHRHVAQMPEDVGTDGIGYGRDYPIYWADRFHPHSMGQHVAFVARSRAEFDAFYQAALKSGRKDNGPPGLRGGGYPQGYYATFVFDPDGNNIEAVCREI
ncbi:MAG: VOC family protein [Chitinophagaceae bacterium]|nr:VOC family protein [Oligoflexus sp.]